MAYADKRSRILGCLVLVVAAPLVLFLALNLFVFRDAYLTEFPRAFDSAQWKARGVNDSRCDMIADLRFRVGVVGRTRADVTRMLGESEDEDNDPSSSHWHLCPSFMDVWILEVRWQNDRAVTAIVRDT
jgi:hypothetical protein